MMKRVPVLVNCEERHREHPRRFEIPPLVQRQNLDVGDVVKLIWDDQNNQQGECGERMWVEVKLVISLSGRRRYKGTLMNRPYYFKGVMQHGQEIEFGPENIAGID